MVMCTRREPPIGTLLVRPTMRNRPVAVLQPWRRALQEKASARAIALPLSKREVGLEAKPLLLQTGPPRNWGAGQQDDTRVGASTCLCACRRSQERLVAPAWGASTCKPSGKD